MGEPTLTFPLADWHANPLSASQMDAVLVAARRQRRLAVMSNQSCPHCQLAEFIVAFMRSKSVQATQVQIDNWIRIENNSELCALINLMYGHLLMSRKLLGAAGYLYNGLVLAAPYLESSDYFRVLKRHELLSALILTALGSPPTDLHTLETEARVIRRLRVNRARSSYEINRNDTLG